jgi:hypothetical protein
VPGLHAAQVPTASAPVALE